MGRATLVVLALALALGCTAAPPPTVPRVPTLTAVATLAPWQLTATAEPTRVPEPPTATPVTPVPTKAPIRAR